jgi:hypothetical protein
LNGEEETRILAGDTSDAIVEIQRPSIFKDFSVEGGNR